MPYEQTIRTVRESLCAIIARVDAWFDTPEEVRRYRPTSGGWSIDQVLEHITLTSHFLLLTLAKYTSLAEQRRARGVAIADGESDLAMLETIGVRGSFPWVRPEHMEPTGQPTTGEVRQTLRRQLSEGLLLLERLQGGLGALCRVTMTVNALGKIDLYQWLYFLGQHAQRHLAQMEACAVEYRSTRNLHPTSETGIVE